MTTTEAAPGAHDVSVVVPRPDRGAGDTAAAAAAAAAGSPVVLLDTDAALLVLLARHATPARIAFMVAETSGFLCVALDDAVAERLRLPLMHPAETSSRTPGAAVSIDAAEGVSTGISARDRARTCALLASPTTKAEDLTRPGHVIPIRVAATDRGHAAAAVALARLAGVEPAVVIAHLMTPDGRVRSGRHDVAHLGLPVVDVDALVP